MTKEEQLGKYPIVASNDGTRLFVEKKFALKAMDEYAKQQAIAFAQHMFRNVWKMNSMSASPYVSGDQYYNQFIEQQNK